MANVPPWRRFSEQYQAFQQREEIPIHDGWAIKNVHEAETVPWERIGGKGAFVNLRGMENLCDVHLIQIPPGETLHEQRHLHEGIVFVASGSGITTTRNESDPSTFEWEEGSMFHLPRNTPYVHANVSKDHPALLLTTTPLPLLYSLHHYDEYLWETEGTDELTLAEDKTYYATAADVDSEYHEDLRYYDARFVADATTFNGLESWDDRGGGGRSVFFTFPNSSMFSHMSEFASGQYKKAHRHLSSANILILSGEGYSHLWSENHDRIRIDWQPGTLLTPPTMWFHQHFNTSPDPARYIVFHGPIKGTGINDNNLLNPLRSHNQIEYQREDSEIRQEFQQELANRGIENKMDESLYEGRA